MKTQDEGTWWSSLTSKASDGGRYAGYVDRRGVLELLRESQVRLARENLRLLQKENSDG